MPLLHEPSTRAGIEARIRALTPDSRPTWGKMSVDQMLWHMNQAMGLSLGTVTVGPGGPTMPAWLMRLIVIKLPWPKGAPTHPDVIPKQQYSFAGERDLALRNIAEIAGRPLDYSWPVHSAFGKMSGRQVNALTYKHLNHHLTQFGV